MQIMITNGGAHPPDYWAEITTEALLNLIEIPEGASSPEAIAARSQKRELRGKLFDILFRQHEAVQQHERGECAGNKKHAHSTVFDPLEHIDEIAADLDLAFAGTSFAEHFAQPEVRDIVHKIVGQHFVNSMSIERSYAKVAKGA